MTAQPNPEAPRHVPPASRRIADRQNTYVATHPPSRLVTLGLAGLALLLTAIFLVAHAHYPGVPAAGSETGGWHEWADQSKYIEAARAWADWDLTPARHWFLPGYPLLGALWLPLTPHDRFLLPDLACLIASQFASAALARRMFPQGRFASLWGAAAFLVASVGTLPGLKSWLVPWTTTPSAALTFAAFVAVLRLAEHPGIGRALLAGGAIGGITLFRPSDAMPVAFAAAVALAPLLYRLPLRDAAGIAAASLLATSLPVGLTAGIIAATSGFGPGTYYALTGHIGFEFRLLPLRWVSLVIDPRPLFDGVGTERVEPGLHRGLVEVFPWMLGGVGGVAACWFSRGEKCVYGLLATWLATHMALYLSYRDLHILGLWLFGNFHYFKVTQPVFLLFALVLAVRLADRATRWRAAAAALAAIVLLFGWRASLTPLPPQLPLPAQAGQAAHLAPVAQVAPATTQMAQQGAAQQGAGQQRAAHDETAQPGKLPQGLPEAPARSATADSIAIPALGRLDAAAIIRGGGTWNAFFYGHHILTIDGVPFRSPYDFRLYPRSSDFLLIPVRPLPPQPGLLTVTEGVHVAPDVPSVKLRQTIVFGLPCAFGLAGTAVCGTLGAPLIPSR